MKKFLSLAFVAIFVLSCSKEKSEIGSKIMRTTIKNSEYLYGTSNTQTKSKSSTDQMLFFSIDNNGNSQPIRFITELGDTVNIPIMDMYDINQDYILLHIGNYNKYDNVSNHLLVDKNEGILYSIPISDYTNINNYSGTNYTYTDRNGNIYLNTYENFDRMIYKINPSSMIIEKYIPNNQNYENYIVSPNGTCYYSDLDNRNGKFKANNGSIYLVSQFVDYDMDRDKIEVFLGFNESFYIRHDTDSAMSIYKVNTDYALTSEFVVQYNKPPYWWFQTNKFLPNHVRQSHIISNGEQVLEFNENNRTLQLLSIQLPKTQNYSNSYYVTTDALYIKDRGDYNEIYSFTKLNLSSNTTSHLDFATAGYEVHSITSSKYESTMSFGGIRFSDGKNIIGQIDVNGYIQIFETYNIQNQVMNLIRLN